MLLVRRDINGHVRLKNAKYDEEHRGHDFGTINKERKALLNFTIGYKLKIANTVFKKREKYIRIFASSRGD